MNYLDYFLIFIFLLAAVQGFSRGFIVELFSLLAFIVGIVLAGKYSADLTSLIITNPDWFTLTKVILFVLILIISSMILSGIARIIRKAITLVLLGWLDKSLGIVLSVLKWGFMMSTIIWLISIGGMDLTNGAFASSTIFPYVAHFAPLVFDFIGSFLPYFRDVIDGGEVLGQPKRFV